MIRLKSLLKESLLNELEFGTQKAFDSYQKKHDMRDDTVVTVAGKKMNVGQAKKQSKDSEVKGSSVFGKDGGSKVFGGAKEKSITDIKVDAKVDVSKVSKSLLPNLKLDMSPGGADKDANELKTRLEKGHKGSYTRTSPTGGRIDFEDGASFDVYRPHTYKKTKDTKIYASKQNK